jgi:hypothetical protein
MILTPNIAIDNTHMNAFQEEFETYNSTPGEESTHWGTGELESCDVIIKKIRTLQGNGMYVCVNNGKEGILICRLIAAPVPQGALPWGRKIYVMDKIRVHADYIGRDLAPAIYRWLAEHGYTIMSDSHQNQNSLAVWRKLATTNKVYTININDGMWRPYDPLKIEDWMLFGNGDLAKYWPIRLVMPAS